MADQKILLNEMESFYSERIVLMIDFPYQAHTCK